MTVSNTSTLLPHLDMLRRRGAGEAAKDSGKPKKLAPETGYRLRPGQGSGQKTLISDGGVRAIRAFYEFYGYRPKELAAISGLSVKYIVDLTGYRVRSKLFPRDCDFQRPRPGCQRPDLEVLAEKLRQSEHKTNEL